MAEEKRVQTAEQAPQMSRSTMNRLFCSTKERVAYVVHTATSGATLGKYDTGSAIYLYKIYGLPPVRYAKASATLGVYDIVNDPITAVIIDRMRTRWGKFKPFQYMALLPNLLIGLFNCLLPLIATSFGFSETGKLWSYMAVLYATETINALIGGGAGYINNVFTPNPNERTSLLVMSKFASDLCGKLPEQIMGILLDLIDNGKVDLSVVKMYVTFKTVIWVITTIPSIFWILVSKERVPQSETPPNPIHGLMSVFKNKPLLVYTLSGLVDGFNVGTEQSLYFSDVVHFNLMGTIAGIPGSPISYASYPIATKLREKLSTKALWISSRGSILLSESMFFFFGMIGGKEKGMYLRKIPMTIVYSLGNCIEMVFYATKKIIGDEINFEVLDYCEWKNGFRVEATITLIKGYFDKVRDIILKILNAWLLERWAGFKSGVGIEQSIDTKWRMFIAAFGPHLIFDAISILPMFLYNIDKKTRAQMYSELEAARSARVNAKKINDELEKEA